MKKVLVFTPSFFPHLGGVERHVLEVCNYLSQNYSIKLITIQLPKTKSFEQKGRLNIYRFTYPKIKIFGLLMIWWTIYKKYYALLKEADVIHVHDVFVWYLPFRLLFWRKRVVTTFHGWEGIFPLPQKNKLWRKLGVWLSTKTIAVGKYLEKYYDFTADYVIYGGVHLPKELPSKEELLLYVGRLDYDTGLPLLLQSLKQEVWSGKIIFCGDGVLKDQAKQFGEVVGFKNPMPFLKRAKVVFAGGYLSVLEAFAYRCLVVAAYNNPLKKDYFGLSPLYKFVHLVSSAPELTRKIKFLTEAKVFNQKKLAQAYAFAQEHSWQKIAKIYAQLYQTL